MNKRYSLNLPKGYVKKPIYRLNEWVAALRSEKYKKGRFFFFKKEAWCVLGVYCAVCGVKKKQLSKGRGVSKIISRKYGFRDSREGFPVGVFVEFDGNYYNSLMRLNDETGIKLTFHEIADILEQVYCHSDNLIS